MERVVAGRTVPVVLDGVERAVSPRIAYLLSRLVVGRAELDRLDHFQARFDMAGERVQLYVTTPVRLGQGR